MEGEGRERKREGEKEGGSERKREGKKEEEKMSVVMIVLYNLSLID